jgi:hypothetical protein
MRTTQISRVIAASLLAFAMNGVAWSASSVNGIDLIKYSEDLTVSPPVTFHGKVLTESPDITEPELRLANQLLSAGCVGHSHQKWTNFAKANPTNGHVSYLETRFKWMRHGNAVAEGAAAKVLAKEPDFSSVKVLLAGIRLEQIRFQDAHTLLDEVEERSPTDLWVFMNRLRLEAVEEPSRGLRSKLLEIVRNPGFPPNARDIAAEIGMSLPKQTNTEVEEFMWERLEVISNHSWECKVSELAQRLSEIGGRYDEARKLLESWHADKSDCDRKPMNSLMLAQAYLMAAAKIAPRLVPGNQALVDKAQEVVGSDFSGLRAYVENRPNAAMLAPFMVFRPKPEPVDASGRTAICVALKKLDQLAVFTNLQGGANPNGKCDGKTLMGSVMFVDTNDRATLRVSIASLLMARGARPSHDEIGQCGMAMYGDCQKVMLPFLEENLR